MPSRFLRLGVTFALLCGIDAHLALLQGCAWTTMTWRAARDGRALSETFDGRHPCKICAAVKKAAPAASLSATAAAKADLFHPATVSLALARPARPDVAVLELKFKNAFLPPRTPPPKALLS